MTKSNLFFLSVVIPVYNEEKRLKKLLSIIKYLQSRNFNSEIIIINDGSVDRTLKKLNYLKKKHKFSLISYLENRGKGFAIKCGMLAAHGKYRLFTDIDLSTPIGEFDKFIPHLKKYHIVIGSRKLKESDLLVHQPVIRENLGKIFTLLSRISLQIPVSDFTCGFKCFSQKAAKEIFSKQTIERWGFDPEILFIGKKKGFSIKEIPIIWKNSQGTKVKFPQDIIRSITDLIKIHYNNMRDLYG